MPPLLAADDTDRDRSALPVPQLMEQEVHVPHAPTVQSEGQKKLLHSLASRMRSGHAAPSPFCGCVMLRERAVAPSSQLREHIAHAAHQSTVQSAEAKGDDGLGDGSRVGAGVGAAVGVS